jgi:hypothetical protein
MALQMLYRFQERAGAEADHLSGAQPANVLGLESPRAGFEVSGGTSELRRAVVGEDAL